MRHGFPFFATPSFSLLPQSFFPLFSSYIYHLVDDLPALRHTTLSVLRDFARDGVVYLELRTTPRALPKSGISKAGYVGAILDVIREFEDDDDEPVPSIAEQVATRVSPTMGGEVLARRTGPRDPRTLPPLGNFAVNPPQP